MELVRVSLNFDVNDGLSGSLFFNTSEGVLEVPTDFSVAEHLALALTERELGPAEESDDVDEDMLPPPKKQAVRAAPVPKRGGPENVQNDNRPKARRTSEDSSTGPLQEAAMNPLFWGVMK